MNDNRPNAPMRVFCPKHDEYRAVYTCGRPELNDVCPQCEIEDLRKRVSYFIEREAYIE